MSSYEIDRYIENQYRSARNDAAVVEGATMDDLDRELLTGWLSRVRATTLGRSAALSDEELMANRRVVSPDAEGVLRPTVAGIMALGFCPQQFFPRANVVFTAYPTPKKGEVGRAGERFSDSVDIDGPIPVMVVDAVRAASRNMKHGAIVKGALRENVPDYPLAAVREAVANALMHRDYSPDALGTPVMVDLYPDRLELSNPGSLFGSLTVERLGQRGATASRNQFLARILEDVPYSDVDGGAGRVVENRGSGYPTINRELEQALMPAPIVKSTLDEFVLIMRHRRMTDQEGRSYTKENVMAAILGYVTDRESVSTSELAKASGMSMKTVADICLRLWKRESGRPTAPSGAIAYVGSSSLVARRAHSPEVIGSNPAPATKSLQLGGEHPAHIAQRPIIRRRRRTHGPEMEPMRPSPSLLPRVRHLASTA